jgi:SAM-dependent methyltransferase
MCHPSVLAFGTRVLTAEHVQGRRVLEVGARNINGSLRGHVEALGPEWYCGLDLETGSGVDWIADITRPSFSAATHEATWDLIICTEMLEHVLDWRAAVNNMKALLAPGGRILLTTRSLGFPFHEYPGDFWRFELWDMAAIFRDFLIDVLEPDPEAPGVFLFATKPPSSRYYTDTSPVDLSTLQLHSMQTGARAL